MVDFVLNGPVYLSVGLWGGQCPLACSKYFEYYSDCMLR